MIMFLDPDGLRNIYFYRQSRVRRQMRYYYLAEPPVLAIIVSCIGNLQDYPYSLADVSAGLEEGYPGFCTPGYEYCFHSKLTIRRLLEDTVHPDTSMSIFLQNSRGE